MMNILRAVANFWNLALLVTAIATILWFVHVVFLRKFLRARRIANIRLARIVRERSAERQHENQ
jgi:hypothetical protein